MRKMTAIIITALIAGTIGAGAMALCSVGYMNAAEHKLAQRKTEIEVLQNDKAFYKELSKDKTACINRQDETITEQAREITRLTNDVERLSGVISRLRQNPNWLKERIPAGNTNCYSFEPYITINNTSSSQFYLQKLCKTDSVTGIRVYTDRSGEEYYTAALGSAYGSDIGDAWKVTLDNGESFNIMLGDFKDDGKTEFFGHDCKNAHEEPCTNVIEFIVDVDKLPAEVLDRGSFSVTNWCNGNIVEMKYLGRVWD